MALAIIADSGRSPLQHFGSVITSTAKRNYEFGRDFV